MCLWIRLDQKENEKNLDQWFRSQKKYTNVYKVLRKRHDEDFYRSTCYPNFIWDFKNQKVFEINRSPKPTEEELFMGQVNYGLHVYISLERAKLACFWTPMQNATGLAIVNFHVKAENIIAVESDFSSAEAVCTKLEFVKIMIETEDVSNILN